MDCVSTVRTNPSIGSSCSFLNDSGNRFGHATNSQSSVTNFVPSSTPYEAAQAVNGSSLPVIGHGSIHPFLTKVAVIPSLTEPILSTRQLAEEGITSVFLSDNRGGGALMINDNDSVVAQSDSSYKFHIGSNLNTSSMYLVKNRSTIATDTKALNRVRTLQRKLKGWG